MRFLPARALCEPIKSSRAERQRRAERWERTRWPLHAHPKQPRAEISKYRPEGQPKQHDGAHQTSVQESQGNENAHSPTRE